MTKLALLLSEELDLVVVVAERHGPGRLAQLLQVLLRRASLSVVLAQAHILNPWLNFFKWIVLEELTNSLDNIDYFGCYWKCNLPCDPSFLSFKKIRRSAVITCMNRLNHWYILLSMVLARNNICICMYNLSYALWTYPHSTVFWLVSWFSQLPPEQQVHLRNCRVVSPF